eukprot:362754-Chlamydomonas_euryale.AAC.10
MEAACVQQPRATAAWNSRRKAACMWQPPESSVHVAAAGKRRACGSHAKAACMQQLEHCQEQRGGGAQEQRGNGQQG